MSLSDRRESILQIVIQDYIETATPVASRHVVERYALPTSAATIRHEMQLLESDGYLTHPHTSAGRVPSNRGYRHFVQSLMGHAELGVAEQATVRHQFFQAAPAVDEWAALAATVLAQSLGLLAVVAPPQPQRLRVRQLELISLNDLLALMIVVVQEARVIRQLTPLPAPCPPEQLDAIAHRLNMDVNGHDSDAVRDVVAADADEQAVLDTLARVLDRDVERSGAVSIAGLGGVMSQPEFHAEPERSLQLIELVDRQAIEELVPHAAIEQRGLRVLIGDDNPSDQLRDCSLVVATYGYEYGRAGYVAIIGPTRMNYSRSVASARFHSSLLQEMMDTVYGGAA